MLRHSRLATVGLICVKGHAGWKSLVFTVWDAALPVVTLLRWPPLTPLIISLPISVSEHTCTHDTCDAHRIPRFSHTTQHAYQLPRLQTCALCRSSQVCVLACNTMADITGCHSKKCLKQTEACIATCIARPTPGGCTSIAGAPVCCVGGLIGWPHVYMHAKTMSCKVDIHKSTMASAFQTFVKTEFWMTVMTTTLTCTCDCVLQFLLLS